MSVERAMVARARPHMGASLALALLQDEVWKGCSPDLAPTPVRLEPSYRFFSGDLDALSRQVKSPYEPLPVPRQEELRSFKAWLSPDHTCNWQREERFLKELAGCAHSIAYEVTGNEGGIDLIYLCHADDAPVLAAAFAGEYPACRLEPHSRTNLDSLPVACWEAATFREYFPPPPYSHLFTRPNELGSSPLSPLLNLLSDLPCSLVGIYQVILTSVAPEHDWHRNVRLLLDVEFQQSMQEGMQPHIRYAQQLPSADLRGMALDLDSKAHNDKGLYAAVARVALIPTAPGIRSDGLASLAVFMNLFQHGGRPLQWVDQDAFAAQLAPQDVRAMFLYGLSYRPGFILNSEELSGFVHVVPVPEDLSQVTPVNRLDGLGPTSSALSTGTLIGYRKLGSQDVPIHIPDHIAERHGSLIGGSGSGKTYLLEQMVLQDINEGRGAVVLDPHGDLSMRLLGLIPEHRISRVIHFDPANRDAIPLWNPLAITDQQDPSRVSDEMLSSIHRISDGWGDRLAHLLRQVINGLLLLGDATLLDVAVLLGGKCPEKERLKKRIIAVTHNPMSARFWEFDIDGYTKADVHPVMHKLGKLLGQDTVAMMLSQPDNRFDFRRMMDNGLIFIADLSGLGPETRDTLGRFIMSFIYLAALSRSDMPADERRPFRVYVDEAHRLIGGVMTDLIAQTRKYQVSLVLAHQFLSQFRPEDNDALGTTGFNVIFNVLRKDAERLVRSIGRGVEPTELTLLERQEAFARIGTEWVKITTPMQTAQVDPELRQRIIAASQERYCFRPDQIQSASAARPRPSAHTQAIGNLDGWREEDFYYEPLLPRKRG